MINKKLCKDCYYYKHKTFNNKNVYCLCKYIQKTNVYYACNYMRETICGEDAKLFKKRTLLQKLFKIIF
jgi:hypothetical protein